MDRRAFLAAIAAGLLLPRSARATPFRRLTDPIMVPVGKTASSMAFPAGFFTTQQTGRYASFLVVNPNACYVRLQGFTGASASQGRVSASTGWNWPPGFVGVFATQYPDFVSAVALDEPAYPLANVTRFVPLELSYGYGD